MPGDGLTCLIIFQSYLSPIQTMRRSVSAPRSSNFQSYLSPIQTQEEYNAALRETAFNPTLVQFKREEPLRDNRASLAFNPTLVQFKRDGLRPEDFTAGRFQSYLSPIQTRPAPCTAQGSSRLSILP